MDSAQYGTLPKRGGKQKVEHKRNRFRTMAFRHTRAMWLPKQLYPDDVFIVSYPRSGNTWVRFLFANLLGRQGEEIDFYSVHQHVPEVGRHESIIERLQHPRLIKSHSPYVPEYSKVIYIVRDGRDVYVSYYFYNSKRLPHGTTFKEFLKRTDHFPCLWSEHVSSWLFDRPESSNVLVVRFEDLISNCLAQLERMCRFIGLERNTEELRSAVSAASFSNLHRLETERGRPYAGEQTQIFTRSGNIGDWHGYFGIEEKQIYKSREGHVLIQAGYEVDNNW
jgi:estrone sulfotransferase